jgi:hypothetical protein
VVCLRVVFDCHNGGTVLVNDADKFTLSLDYAKMRGGAGLRG